MLYIDGPYKRVSAMKPHLLILPLLLICQFAWAEGDERQSVPIDEMTRVVTDAEKKNDFSLVEIKAEAGDREAQYKLAQYYMEGYGVEKDMRKAMFWLDRSARNGFRSAQIALADLYFKGIVDNQPYYAHALKWYEKAANQGSAYAMAMTGKMYYKGIGTDRNYEIAFQWLLKAAQNGDVESQHLVAVMYRFGHGEERSYLHAYVWYEVALSNTKPDTEEYKKIERQKNRLETIMPENERLAAKLIAPEFIDQYSIRK